MEQDETLHVLCLKFYQETEETAKSLNFPNQFNKIDHSKESKKRSSKEKIKNEPIKKHNSTNLLHETTIPAQTSPDIENFLLQSFIKEFTMYNEMIEDYLERNYIRTNKRFVHFSDDSEINNLRVSIEKVIDPKSKDFQKCLTLKVKYAPLDSSLIPTSEIILPLAENPPKTIGGHINKLKDPTIYIYGKSRLYFNLKNNRVFIKEEIERRKQPQQLPQSQPLASAMILIANKKIIENCDTFLIGNTNFEFDIEIGQWIELRYTTTNRGPISRKWNWTDNSKISIGRDESNTIAIPIDGKISKKHAVIKFFEDNWVIVNKKSKNGVWNYLHNTKTIKTDIESREIEILESSQFFFHKALFEVKSINP